LVNAWTTTATKTLAGLRPRAQGLGPRARGYTRDKEASIHEYDLIADWYAEDRQRSEIGRPEAVSLAASLSPGARVLDIGCGPGVPVTRALVDAGLRVVGFDSSARMISHFRRNFPNTPVACGSIVYCPFSAGAFDAAVAWGVLFHLPHHTQRRAFFEVGRVLRPGAPFLFTAGDIDDAHSDLMNGVTFPYYSFTTETYRQELAEHGLKLVDTHADVGQNIYYLARRMA